MELLNSISNIEKKFPTNGSRPILILAEGIEHYICKYPRSTGDMKLMKEFIGQRFAREWGIQVPEIVEIQVLREHIPENMLGEGLSYNSLENSIIGFKQIETVTEVMDKFSEGIGDNDINKYVKEDFLLIALFDIWLSNDDRNTNNTNILINSNENEIRPIAIDHEMIFNTGSLDRDIYELTYEDSLFYSKLYHRLFRNSKKTVELIEKISSSLRPNVNKCHDRLDDILNEIPSHWISTTDVHKQRLENNIFTDSWLNKVETTFKEFASLAIRNT